MKTVFILAAGDGTRWNNYRGSPKHRLVVEGEVLIERTYRQFSKYADKVIIVANEEMGFAETYIPVNNKKWRDIAKFYSSRDIWTEGKNVLVFADVYFTDEAVERIMNDPYGLSFYLRSKGSHLTKKLWKEIWGIGFEGSSIPILESAILKIIESKENYSAGGWRLYDQFTQDKQKFKSIEIDDWTEDFDFPADIDTWEKRRKRVLAQIKVTDSNKI
jgi:CTP:phosphocholine cytidylyltransferase-like protein